MWRSPLAYGQATATRIFLGEFVLLTAANHRESFSGDPLGSKSTEDQGQRKQSTHERGRARAVEDPGEAIAFR